MAPVRKLNLGCGRDVRAGWVNVDRIRLPGVDAVLDLESPLPFADGVLERVHCSHVLEHVDRFLELMEELHRVLAPEGRLTVVVPHLSFFGSYTDPTHRRFFGYHSFDYFTPGGTCSFYSRARFRIVRREIRFFWSKNERREVRSKVISGLINLWPLLYERFFCWMLPANEAAFELERVPAEGAATPRSR